jgi:hypothetical protein
MAQTKVIGKRRAIVLLKVLKVREYNRPTKDKKKSR